MKIRYASDLHLDTIARHLKSHSQEDLERAFDILPPHPDDPRTVLALAGDLWTGTRSARFGPDGYSFIGSLCRRFLAVVIVLGNHDCWGERIPDCYAKFAQAIAPFPNATLLEAGRGSGSVLVGDVRFIGSTLWASLNNADPAVLCAYQSALDCSGRSSWGDCRNIRVAPHYRRFGARDMLALHRQCLAGLRKELAACKEKAVLLTHMAPSLASLGKGSGPFDPDDYAYATDLESELLGYGCLKAAIHGHIHEKSDYLRGGARFCCNPLGYFTQNAEGFDPQAFIEV